MNKWEKWFTLVELIVVITILAILWTIAFISMQWYSKSSRDSVRISDMSAISSSLALFNIESWKFPDVTNPYDVTFSWSIAWTQWIFWEATFNNVDKLDKIPIDPLTWKNYSYSITSSKSEYQLSGLLENDELWLISDIYAEWEKKWNAIVRWTYNWKVLRISNWNISYVLATPSIVSWEMNTLENIYTNKSFVYNGYSNLPFSLSWSSYNTLSESNLNLVSSIPSEYIVYSWSISDLSDPSDSSERLIMLSKLKTAYSWTLNSDSSIAQITSIDNFSDTNTQAVDLSCFIVDYNIANIKYSNCNGWWVANQSVPNITLPVCTFDDINSTFDWCVFWS